MHKNVNVMQFDLMFKLQYNKYYGNLKKNRDTL